MRGWEVRSEADDDKVGSVDDVLMDSAGTPHLLDVNLGAFSHHVLVPLSQAWADASRRVVWIEGLRKGDIKQMPQYDHKPDALTPEFESKLVADYDAAAAGAHRKAARPASNRLARLGKGDDFRVSKGSSDPRGWKVTGGDGAKLGKVTELVVDAEDMRVRYLDVDVEENRERGRSGAGAGAGAHALTAKGFVHPVRTGVRVSMRPRPPALTPGRRPAPRNGGVISSVA